MLADFIVAEGVTPPPKPTTTVVFTRLDGRNTDANSPRLLGPDWLARWRRSGSKYPAGLAEAERVAFERRVETHPQFAVSVGDREGV